MAQEACTALLVRHLEAMTQLDERLEVFLARRAIVWPPFGHSRRSRLIGHILLGIPWFWPGVAASILIAAFAAGPLGRRLSIGTGLAWLFLMSLGGITSLTLTPGLEAFVEVHRRTCDFSLTGTPSLDAIRTINETSLNVALFVPLGVSIALVARSPIKPILAAGALALPLAIEGFQFAVPAFARQCQVGDIASNLTGLIVGLVIGSVVGAVVGAVRR